MNDEVSAKQINAFIRQLMQTSTRNIAELEIDTFNNENALLDGHEFVEKVAPQNLAKSNKCENRHFFFEIPIKPYEVSPQSNLNAFLEKAENPKTVLSNHDIGTKLS